MILRTKLSADEALERLRNSTVQRIDLFDIIGTGAGIGAGKDVKSMRAKINGTSFRLVDRANFSTPLYPIFWGEIIPDPDAGGTMIKGAFRRHPIALAVSTLVVAACIYMSISLATFMFGVGAVALVTLWWAIGKSSEGRIRDFLLRTLEAVEV